METNIANNGTNNRIGILSFPKGINRNLSVDNFSLDDIVNSDNEFDKGSKVDAETQKLLEKYSGSSVSENGDILNDKGEVVKTKAEIEADNAVDNSGNNKGDNNPNNIDPAGKVDVNTTKNTDNNTSVEEIDGYIDENGDLVDAEGVIFTKKELEEQKRIDDKGNLVDPETGEILITAEQLSKGTDNISVAGNLVAAAIVKENLTFTNQDGTPKVYAKGIEGLTDYYNDVANYKSLQAQNEFLDSNPAIKEFARHILAGGTKESFYEKVGTDFLTKEYKDLTTDEVDKAVLTFYKKKGINEDMAKAMVSTMKDADTFKDFSEKAFAELALIKKQEDDAEVKRIIDAREKEEKDNEKYWNDVQTIVNKGTLSNVNIPDTEKTLFWDYLTKPVDKEGRTQELLDRTARDLNADIQLAYLQFKKWDIKSLVNIEMNKAKVKSIREAVKAQAAANIKNQNAGNKDSRQKTENPLITDLEVEDLHPQL